MKKINWFGRMYYGKKLEYKRSFLVAFKCFIEWDVWGNLLGIHYVPIPGAKAGKKWLQKKYRLW